MSDLTPEHPKLPPSSGGGGGLLARDNLLLSQALEALRQGDLELAQSIVQTVPSAGVTLGDAFRLYQAELENVAIDLRENQQRAESSLDWFVQVFRGLPMPAVLVDGRGMIVDANVMAIDELGLMAQPLPRTPQVPLRRLMGDTDSEARLVGTLPRVNAVGVVALDNVRLRTLDGRLRWADLRLSQVPPRLGDRLASGILCLVHDRTSQMAAAEALELTARARAEHERDVATAATRAKTQLLSRVSHELRTPLNAVIGFSELLLSGREGLSPDARFKLQHIQKAGQQLLGLVEDILQINVAEGGQLRQTPARLDVWPLVNEVVQQLGPVASAAQIELDADALPDSHEALAWADAERTREILNNLVSNAIKYNRTGGWVRLVVTRNDEQVRIEVRDNGRGMDADQISHAFEPFNRVGAEKTRVPGYGLGLTIARTLAVAMDGDLAVQSQPGVGSSFFLTLPALRPLRAV
jgi:signal transduction histidine kinase